MDLLTPTVIFTSDRSPGDRHTPFRIVAKDYKTCGDEPQGSRRFRRSVTVEIAARDAMDAVAWRAVSKENAEAFLEFAVLELARMTGAIPADVEPNPCG